MQGRGRRIAFQFISQGLTYTKIVKPLAAYFQELIQREKSQSVGSAEEIGDTTQNDIREGRGRVILKATSLARGSKFILNISQVTSKQLVFSFPRIKMRKGKKGGS